MTGFDVEVFVKKKQEKIIIGSFLIIFGFVLLVLNFFSFLTAWVWLFGGYLLGLGSWNNGLVEKLEADFPDVDWEKVWG